MNLKSRHELNTCVLRRYLRETLKMANAEDLNRLTACSLVLLGHIFLSLGNSQVSLLFTVDYDNNVRRLLCFNYFVIRNSFLIF